MKVSVSIDGATQLQQRFADVAEAGLTGRLLRKGMSNTGRILTNAYKNSAPVRRGRVQVRKLNRLLQRGVSSSTALRRSSVQVVKVRRMNADFIGPRNQIKPGQLKRSIHFRIRKSQSGVFILRSGMNVGLKRNDHRRAPHAHLVGLGTKRRDKSGPNRGIMPQNKFIATATNFAAAAAMNALDAGFNQEVVSVLKGRGDTSATPVPAGAT